MFATKTLKLFAGVPLAGALLLTQPAMAATTVTSDQGTKVAVEAVASFDEPWAMTFLPDGSMLVTEKAGTLLHVSADGKEKTPVAGVPAVAYGGQGGLADVVLHPKFSENHLVYISFAEEGDGGYGGALARGKLVLDGDRPRLEGVKVIWRQEPKVSGMGQYALRVAFGPDGMMFVTSGERQKKTPAEEMDTNLGKIVRLHDDGSVPSDNPFQDKGEIAREIWTLGHRNPLGIAFDAEGQLWEHEMGPRGGDELNRIRAGANYGWPVVSNGINYDGSPIPDHDTRPEFQAPQISWTPVIAPAGFVIYDGEVFPDWQGDGFIGGLRSQALVHVSLGAKPKEIERFPMGHRIREVEQGPDGALFLLEDGSGGRLLKLTPAGAAG
ncbi:PQQ-dependent sugar dehydrogenase [Jiella sonneratiae]|uniref:PQQ-dependent sugar dehydrogenase n=1 Tax=Jiella sonneratiae TaxID=2816856 RepID=A0ABS3JAN6_9HYPH|nr:PQQ-dependent sugar dehydrogenase [Jiella sonneratiae]MBO0906008.1 PQQ-dependent sugar dehydrogenase [Jiella sonneratiae]